MTVHINTTVASRFDSSIVGELKRKKGDYGYVMPTGAKEPLKLKLADLITVKKGRPAQGSMKAEKPDNVIRHDLTSKVQIIVQGLLRGKMFETIKRTFPTVKEARDYLRTLPLVKIEGRGAQLKEPAEADIRTNYDIKKILDAVAPKDLLPVIIFEGPESRKLVMPVRERDPVTSEAPGEMPSRGVTIKRPASKSGLVPLKQICRELNIDAREARMKLRALSRKKLLSHEPQGRWEWSADQVEEIKAQLTKGADKPATAKEIKNAVPVIEEVTGVKPTKEQTAKIITVAKKMKGPHPTIKNITFTPEKGKDITPPKSKKKLVLKRSKK